MKKSAPATSSRPQRRIPRWEAPEPDWSSAPWLRQLFEEPPPAGSKAPKRLRKATGEGRRRAHDRKRPRPALPSGSVLQIRASSRGLFRLAHGATDPPPSSRSPHECLGGTNAGHASGAATRVCRARRTGACDAWGPGCPPRAIVSRARPAQFRAHERGTNRRVQREPQHSKRNQLPAPDRSQR